MSRRVGAALAAAVLLLAPAAVFVLIPWREAVLPAPAEMGGMLDAAAFVPVARPRSAPAPNQRPPAAGAGDPGQDFKSALGTWESTTPRNPLQYR